MPAAVLNRYARSSVVHFWFDLVDVIVYNYNFFFVISCILSGDVPNIIFVFGDRHTQTNTDVNA